MDMGSPSRTSRLVPIRRQMGGDERESGVLRTEPDMGETNKLMPFFDAEGRFNLSQLSDARHL
jgi:hypothetical protein